MAATITQVEKYFQGSTEYGTIKVSVPSADVLNMGTQIDVITTVAANRGIEFLSGFGGFPVYNTTPYATNTTIAILCDTANVTQASSTGLMAASVACYRQFIKATSSGATGIQIIANKKLCMVVTGGNPTNGDSIFVAYISYRIITVV